MSAEWKEVTTPVPKRRASDRRSNKQARKNAARTAAGGRPVARVRARQREVSWQTMHTVGRRPEGRGPRCGQVEAGVKAPIGKIGRVRGSSLASIAVSAHCDSSSSARRIAPPTVPTGSPSLSAICERVRPERRSSRRTQSLAASLSPRSRTGAFSRGPAACERLSCARRAPRTAASTPARDRRGCRADRRVAPVCRGVAPSGAGVNRG